MRIRALITAGTTAVLVGVLPVAAMAQDVTDDPENTDATFVPSAPSGSADTGAAPTDAAPSDTGATDELPNTGGGLALAGGAALAGAALLRRRA